MQLTGANMRNLLISSIKCWFLLLVCGFIAKADVLLYDDLLGSAELAISGKIVDIVSITEGDTFETIKTKGLAYVVEIQSVDKGEIEEKFVVIFDANFNIGTRDDPKTKLVALKNLEFRLLLKKTPVPENIAGHLPASLVGKTFVDFTPGSDVYGINKKALSYSEVLDLIKKNKK